MEEKKPTKEWKPFFPMDLAPNSEEGNFLSFVHYIKQNPKMIRGCVKDFIQFLYSYKDQVHYISYSEWMENNYDKEEEIYTEYDNSEDEDCNRGHLASQPYSMIYTCGYYLRKAYAHPKCWCWKVGNNLKNLTVVKFCHYHHLKG